MSRNSIARFFGDIDRRQIALDRIDRLTEVPLLCLAFFMIPLLAGPFFWDQSANEERVFLVLDIAIWTAFAVDLMTKVVGAPKRLEFVRSHWLEVLVVILPFARPLRLVRAILYGSRAVAGSRRLTEPDFLIVYAVGLVAISATLLTIIETEANPNVGSFTDALWLSFATITTVGYGDISPVTPVGRIIALFLMLGGIGVFAGMAARLASIFMRTDERNDEAILELLAEVRILRRDIDTLKKSDPAPDSDG